MLGGSYPENHPILTTPSLFTENPTYEDMVLLSALLGPAKPPVASATDVETAGGLYQIEVRDVEMGGTARMNEQSAEYAEKEMQRLVEEQIRREEEEAGLIAPRSYDKEQQNAAADLSFGDVMSVDTTKTPKIEDAAKTGVLVAVAEDGSNIINLNLEQRCLVCLCEFEAKEVARRLGKCGHIFHRECIDQVCSPLSTITSSNRYAN